MNFIGFDGGNEQSIKVKEGYYVVVRSKSGELYLYNR